MSCEYYIPNTEELDYVGTKDLKVQSLDLLWSLRLFVTGQGWRVARYLDPESAFPGYAALSKRLQPLVNQLKESERDDSLKDVLCYLYQAGLISHRETIETPPELTEALNDYETRPRSGPELLSPFAENIDLLAKVFSLSEDERLISIFMALVGYRNSILRNIVGFYDTSEGLPLLYQIISCATKIHESRVFNILSSQRSRIFQIYTIREDSRCKGWFYCKHGLSFCSLFERRLTKKDLQNLFYSEVQPPELTLEDYRHIPEVRETIIPYLKSALLTKRHGVNVLLYGAPGTGKTQLSRVLGQELSAQVLEVTNRTKIDDEKVSRLHSWENANASVDDTNPVLFVLDEAEDIFLSGMEFYKDCPIRENKAEINHLLETNPHPTLWLTNSLNGMDRAMMRRFDLVMEITLPTTEQRRAIINKCAGDLLSESMKDRLARTQTLSPGVISRSVSVLKALSKPTQPERDAKMLILINAVLKAQNCGRIAGASAPVEAVYDTAFVNTDTDLQALARGLKGYSSARICLYGPPGTGKSAYAAWLAKTLGKRLLVKKASDLLSMWVGKTEERIAQAFEEAKRDGAVLLIDEADSFLQNRSQGRRSWEITQVNEMLTQMEQFDGIFIATTNLVDTLDPASLRRFDLKAKFDYLTHTQVAALFERWAGELNLPVDDPGMQDLSHLTDITPGDFASVIRQSRFNPIASTEDLARRLVAECRLKHQVSGKKQTIGFS
ncbi:MAG: AAA family ATPase [Sutterella sp.]|nr:AAA family ATPase [Sutterella sp.]